MYAICDVVHKIDRTEKRFRIRVLVVPKMVMYSVLIDIAPSLYYARYIHYEVVIRKFVECASRTNIVIVVTSPAVLYYNNIIICGHIKYRRDIYSFSRLGVLMNLACSHKCIIFMAREKVVYIIIIIIVVCIAEEYTLIYTRERIYL